MIPIIRPRKLHRFFYLEGADGMGKTTFAERITNDLKKENLNVMSVHFSGVVPAFFKDMLHYHYSMVDQILAHLSEDPHNAVVMDRGPLSEYVYGPIMRKGASFQPNLLLTLLITQGARLMLVESDVRNAWESCVKKKELFTKEQWTRVVWEYGRCASSIPMMRIDPFTISEHDYMEAISDAS